MDRPVSPWITQGVCRMAVWLMGLRLVVRGTPMAGRGAVVANHASWLDIFVLNAVDRVYFVSKAEVAGWAGHRLAGAGDGDGVHHAQGGRGARAATDVRGAAAGGASAVVLSGGDKHRFAADIAIQINAVRGVLHAWHGACRAGAAGNGDLSPRTGDGRAVLWLVGRDGIRAASAGGARLGARGRGARWCCTRHGRRTALRTARRLPHGARPQCAGRIRTG